jgi:hypothetical protein
VENFEENFCPSLPLPTVVELESEVTACSATFSMGSCPKKVSFGWCRPCPKQQMARPYQFQSLHMRAPKKAKRTRTQISDPVVSVAPALRKILFEDVPPSPTPATPIASSVELPSLAPEKAVAPARDNEEEIALAKKKLVFEDELQIIDEVEPTPASITLALSAVETPTPSVAAIDAFDDLVATGLSTGFLDFSGRRSDDNAPLLQATAQEEEAIGYSDDNGNGDDDAVDLPIPPAALELPQASSPTTSTAADNAEETNNLQPGNDEDAEDLAMPQAVELPQAEETNNLQPGNDEDAEDLAMPQAVELPQAPNDNVGTLPAVQPALVMPPPAALPANDIGVVTVPRLPAVGPVPINLPPVVQPPTLRRSRRLAAKPKVCYKKCYRLRP